MPGSVTYVLANSRAVTDRCGLRLTYGIEVARSGRGNDEGVGGMSNQHAVFCRTTDGAKIAQADLNDFIIKLSAVALCDEIQHHFSTGTIGLKAARDVNLAMDALP